MKVICPVCSNEGILEVRGNSKRIIHYYYADGKRQLLKHLVSMGTDGNSYMGTMGTQMGTEKVNAVLFDKTKEWASSSVRIEHQPPKLGVEGSNPSPPATDDPRPF